MSYKIIRVLNGVVSIASSDGTFFNVPIENFTSSDLSSPQEQSFDELDLLFSKNKNILSEDDKETIRFVIEKAKRKIDDQIEKNKT